MGTYNTPSPDELEISREIRRHPVVLGDWNPWIRDPIDLLRMAFLAAAIVTAALGELEHTVRMTLTFLLLLGARRLELPRPLDLALVAGMALQAFGNALGLFEQHWHYDKLVHFVLPFAVAPTVYVLLIRLDLLDDLAAEHAAHGRRPLGIVVVTFALGLTVGAIYEMYEYFAVNVLRAGLHVNYGDTIADLADDAMGSLLGAVLLVVWATRGWGTTRRVPADPSIGGGPVSSARQRFS